MTLGEKIKYQRKKYDLTQEELAKEICTKHPKCFAVLSHEAVSRWERGTAEPDVETLSALSDIFNVSGDYWINGTDFEEKSNAGQDNAPVPPGAISGVRTFAKALENLNEKEGGDSDE